MQEIFLENCVYIYEEKYEEKKDELDKDDIKTSDYPKLGLTDDYLYESEEEEKQTDKNPEKKEPPKKRTEIDMK